MWQTGRFYRSDKCNQNGGDVHAQRQRPCRLVACSEGSSSAVSVSGRPRNRSPWRAASRTTGQPRCSTRRAARAGSTGRRCWVQAGSLHQSRSEVPANEMPIDVVHEPTQGMMNIARECVVTARMDA